MSGRLTHCCSEMLRRSQVMIEYIVIGGLNDSEEVAHMLGKKIIQTKKINCLNDFVAGKMLEGRSVYVNLIPYNPTDAG